MLGMGRCRSDCPRTLAWLQPRGVGATAPRGSATGTNPRSCRRSSADQKCTRRICLPRLISRAHADSGRRARVPWPGARLGASSPLGAAARIHITRDLAVLEPAGYPRRGHGRTLCRQEPPGAAASPLQHAPPAPDACPWLGSQRWPPRPIGRCALWLPGHTGLVLHAGRSRCDLRRSSHRPRGRAGEGGAAHHLGLGAEVGRHPSRRGQRVCSRPDRHHRLHDDEASGRATDPHTTLALALALA